MARKTSKARNTNSPTGKKLITIHSQKGGVGKTLIAIYLARKLAQQSGSWKGQRTVLIDADLTGTSLAEALPILAPKNANDHYGLNETRNLLKAYSAPSHPKRLLPYPDSRELRFLNDMLLCPPNIYRRALEGSGKGHEFQRRHLLWKIDPSTGEQHSMGTGSSGRKDMDPGGLRIIPSSGFPRHIAQCVPLIYKEGVTEYLERRLAEVVLSLWTQDWDGHGPFQSIVIDTSPMLRGISRVVLNLHQTLRDSSKWHFAIHLEEFSGFALFVCSPDAQDVADLGRAVDHYFLKEAAQGDETGDSSISRSATPAPSRLLIVNRVPENALVKLRARAGKGSSKGQYNFKDPNQVREYVVDVLRSVHTPSPILLRKKGAALEFFGNPNSVSVLKHDEELMETFLDTFTEKKILYGDVKELPAWSEAFRMFKKIGGSQA